MNKKAFTMIELIFVIVVLGILSAVAIPKFTTNRIDAQISKGRADVASIRSAIMTERQSRLITGDSNYIEAGTGDGQLDYVADQADAGKYIFGGVLTYPIKVEDSDGNWHSRSNPDGVETGTVKFKVAGSNVKFTYTRSDGVFTCVRSQEYCTELID